MSDPGPIALRLSAQSPASLVAPTLRVRFPTFTRVAPDYRSSALSRESQLYAAATRASISPISGVVPQTSSTCAAP